MRRGQLSEFLVAILVCYYIVLGTSLSFTNAELTVMSQLKVSRGQDVFKLACPSSGNFRTEARFGLVPQGFESVVWLIHEQNILVGAGIQYDHSKYRYVASTGELAIRNVDYDDAGIYSCIVKYGKIDPTMETVRHDAMAVKLIVQKPYTNLWEEEYKGNLIRAIIAASIAACLLTMCCAVYKFRWREPSYMRYSSTDIIEVESGLENPGLELEPHQGGDGYAAEKFQAGHHRARVAESYPAALRATGNSNQPTTPPNTDPKNSLLALTTRVHITRI